MPIYQVAAPAGTLTGEIRARVASMITDAHVDATGAPRSFVHVYFNDVPQGAAYSADGVDAEITGIQGAIRAGRTLDQKQALIKRIVAEWAEITGQSPKNVVAGLTEIDSDVTMEYGLILPHPGDETKWFHDNAAWLDGISGTGL
jgi:phenylpyruvate tautomerase PptA (4-oxalocrotonate tautomerase family)